MGRNSIMQTLFWNCRFPLHKMTSAAIWIIVPAENKWFSVPLFQRHFPMRKILFGLWGRRSFRGREVTFWTSVPLDADASGLQLRVGKESTIVPALIWKALCTCFQFHSFHSSVLFLEFCQALSLAWAPIPGISLLLCFSKPALFDYATLILEPAKCFILLQLYFLCRRSW